MTRKARRIPAAERRQDRTNDTPSTAYTIDDGYNLSPLPNGLFGTTALLRSQVISPQETHVFSSQLLNTVRTGSRARHSISIRLRSILRFRRTLAYLRANRRDASQSVARPVPR